MDLSFLLHDESRPCPCKARSSRFGGLLDSLAQAVTYDSALLEMRRARQHARVSVQTERAKLRATRAETARTKNAARREGVVALEHARAERARGQAEVNLRRTAQEGQRRETAQARRAVVEIANRRLLDEAQSDPSRIVTRAGAPVRTVATLNPREPESSASTNEPTLGFLGFLA